jgi:4-amino-4-deoxy-L-arabinose transferase-like glycosyltransferase
MLTQGAANVRLAGLGTEPISRPASAANTPMMISTWLLVVLILVSFIGYISKLNALGLVGPDEPRYASIARSMEESGDWVTPRLNGQPWFEKPVLYYWAAGMSFKLFGVNDYSARLPSALAALLIAAALAWAALKFYGPATTVLVLLFVPTSIAAVTFARAATPDMLFTGTLAVAMVLGAGLVFAENPSLWHRLGFGFFLGAATLAKGPAAIVLAGGGVFLWALFSAQWKRAFRLASPLAILAFILTATPWYAICAARNPDFLRTFFLLHNFERYVTPVFRHVQPFWFFVPIIVLTILPWSALLIALGNDMQMAWRARDWKARPGIYFGCWTAFTLLFFSVSKSKLPGYILPAVPPLLLLLAESAARMIRRRDDLDRGVAMGLGVTWIALAIGAAFWVSRQTVGFPLEAQAELRYWFIAAGIGGAAIAALGSKKRMTAALLLNAMLFAGLFESANWKLLPKLDPYLSARTTALNAVASRTIGVSASDSLGTYRLDRGWQFGLEYYLGRSLPEWQPELGQPSMLFTNEGGCKDIVKRGLICEPVQETTSTAWLVRVSPRTTFPSR